MTPFDTIAGSYDDDFENNFVTRHLRNILWEKMQQYFPARSNILELNCGTGTDAIFLARQGMNVTALDESEVMLNVARKKAEHSGVAKNILFQQLRSEQIASILKQQYDCALSNFGGLNCVHDVESTLVSLSKLLKPKSYVLFCMLNKISVWEILSFLARGKLSKAFRKLNPDGIDVNVGGNVVRTWYYSPSQFIQLMKPMFEPVEIFGLNILSPNPNSRSFINNHPALTERLLKLDESIQSFYPFNSLGDHFVIVARKVR